jgi:hypothetical protein
MNDMKPRSHFLRFALCIISASLSMFLSPVAVAQSSTGIIQGHVLDESTREPLIGANVLVAGTSIGSTADAEGHFQILNLAPGIYRLQVTTIGYQPFIKADVVVAPGKQVEVVIALEEAAVELGEVTIQPSYFEANKSVPGSSQSLSNEEIRRAPGGLEDVVRAIAVLPGVVQTSAGRNDLIVRGGAPSENLYVVDGHKVPNINHFGTQGATGGPLSFVNLDFVRDLTFSTGGFGVRYGDRLSSVLDLSVEDGRTDRFGGKATISASQFGLNTEGPLGKKGSFIFSARRSYLDFIFRSAGFGFVPEYWDFLGKATFHPDVKNEVSFLNIGALDQVQFDNNTLDKRFDNSQILGNSQDQYFSGLSWKHLLQGGLLTTSLTRSYVNYRFVQTDSLLNPIFQSKSKEGETGLQSDLLLRLAPNTTASAGLEGKTVLLDGTLSLPRFQTSFGDSMSIGRVEWNQRATKSAGYLQVAHRLSPRLTLTVGGRLDYFDRINRKVAFSPRGSASYDLGKRTTVSLSGGVYRQAPSYAWLTTNVQNKQLDFVRSDQAVISIEKISRPDTRVRIEGFIKRYRDYPASINRPYLVLANTGAGFGGSEDGFSSFGLEELRSEGHGIARGVELLLQKRLSNIRCYGIVSLTYGRTDFTGLDGVTRSGLYDQRFVFNLSGGYQPSIKWEFSTKFRLGTGTPYTPYDATGKQSVATYNSKRLPLFHSADIRVDRRWNLSSWTLVTYVDLQNVYNHKNVEGYTWNARKQKVDANTDIGLLPTIGISAEF